MSANIGLISVQLQSPRNLRFLDSRNVKLTYYCFLTSNWQLTLIFRLFMNSRWLWRRIKVRCLHYNPYYEFLVWPSLQKTTTFLCSKAGNIFYVFCFWSTLTFFSLCKISVRLQHSSALEFHCPFSMSSLLHLLQLFTRNG